jgi:exodeoxyribonuclease VII large subunit
MLESLNVLGVLKRGFVLVKDAAGKVIQSAAAMPNQGTLSIQFHDGERAVVVGNTAPSAAPKPRHKKPNEGQAGLFD